MLSRGCSQTGFTHAHAMGGGGFTHAHAMGGGIMLMLCGKEVRAHDIIIINNVSFAQFCIVNNHQGPVNALYICSYDFFSTFIFSACSITSSLVAGRRRLTN